MKQRSLFQNPADELPGQMFLFDPEGWSEKSVSFSDRSDIPSGKSDKQTTNKGDDEMKLFVHKLWKGKRENCDCTQVIACLAESAPSEWFVLSNDESLLNRLQPLYTQAGVRYFGYL